MYKKTTLSVLAFHYLHTGIRGNFNFFSVTIEYLLSNKDIEQLGELQLKSKLLTTEMFLRSGKPQKSLYEIDNKEYFFEEKQHEIIYKVSEVDK